VTIGQAEASADDAVGVQAVVAVDLVEGSGLPEARYAQVGGGNLVDACQEGKAVRVLWVPKTCATWADTLQIAVGSVPRSGAGRAGLGPSGDGMIFGLWA